MHTMSSESCLKKPLTTNIFLTVNHIEIYNVIIEIKSYFAGSLLVLNLENLN